MACPTRHLSTVIHRPRKYLPSNQLTSTPYFSLWTAGWHLCLCNLHPIENALKLRAGQSNDHRPELTGGNAAPIASVCQKRRCGSPNVVSSASNWSAQKQRAPFISRSWKIN